MATLSIFTTLLYGVYVSEKSYLIGVRCLVKREHSRMLAMKVAGHLPQELTDLIEKELYQQEEASVRARWILKAPQQNHRRFRYESMVTEAEMAVHQKMVSISRMSSRNPDLLIAEQSVIGVTTTAVHNTRPLGGPERSPRYIHLSAIRTQPSISLAIPPHTSKKASNSPSFAAGLPYAGNQGAITVTLEGSSSRKSDKATYTPMVTESIPTVRLKPSVGRILSVDGLEMAMREWDSVALEAYIDLLGLHVIAEEGESAESALKPKVHIWQQIDDV